LKNNERYFGRAYVVNDWYITAYEPICINGKPKGILYVGNKEKDLPVLRSILTNLKIGTSGSLFVLDKNGNPVIMKETETFNWKNNEITQRIIKEKKGQIRYANKENSQKKNHRFLTISKILNCTSLLQSRKRKKRKD
jgi:methyl-accepting chemotaxis protein